MEDKRQMWNDAARAGIVLGGISIIYLLCGWALGSANAGSKLFSILGGLLSALLWCAKFIVCILFFKSAMKSFAKANPEVDNSDTFKFGCATALLSSVVYSAFYLAFTKFIQPDYFEASVDALMQSPMMDHNSKEAMAQMLPKMPTISFFVNLAYCTLFGVVLSAIFSRNIPSRNPFSDTPQSPDEQ